MKTFSTLQIVSLSFVLAGPLLIMVKVLIFQKQFLMMTTTQQIGWTALLLFLTLLRLTQSLIMLKIIVVLGST